MSPERACQGLSDRSMLIRWCPLSSQLQRGSSLRSAQRWWGSAWKRYLAAGGAGGRRGAGGWRGGGGVWGGGGGGGGRCRVCGRRAAALLRRLSADPLGEKNPF